MTERNHEMSAILTEEMTELIHSLGALVRKDERCAEIERTIDAYEHSEELSRLISEYNLQQDILADVYAKKTELDEDAKEAVHKRIDQLYAEITNNPVYSAYASAKADFDELTNEIYAELQYVITGSRPCSHDCASCHSDCGHSH